MENFFCCSFTNRERDSGDLIKFTLDELKAYTGSFNNSKFIGRGAFGPVYHGVIQGRQQERNANGQHVAVKCSRNKLEQAMIQGQAEIEYLPKAMHQNIIKLIGYCETQEKFYLVYAFMRNGTVLDKLTGLDWNKTIRIIKGVACAIQKLHGLTPPLIHRDLKLDNILLDKDFTPKLADFGRVTPEEEHVESGTKAYDIYRFGEIILQLIMKEKTSYCIGASVPWGIGGLASRTYFSNEQVVHVTLTSTGCSRQAAEAITEIALDCLHPKPSERPTIDLVLEKLKNL